MAKNLLIVESPAKAKTIEKYLGDDFMVRASMGHIRDLPENDMAVDINNGFQPIYQVSKDKEDIVRQLKTLARQAERVWLATDEDREGEAISWHLLDELGLDIESTYRIVFHEITKSAIQKAVQNPRRVNMALVDAQQARRILDRLVGYELSPVLWKKVKYGLSAGRVQSVAVRLIVEREREILSFKEKAQFKISALFQHEKNKQFKAEGPDKIADIDTANLFLQRCINAKYRVAAVEKKPGKRSPAAPFITSTLQQEAARKLGFSVSQTMTLAQKLYEAGYITYMRTDSVNLSEEALTAIGQVIHQNYGIHYHHRRQYTNKTANAQEAHEAIRPTDFTLRNLGADAAQKKLYELIWKRAVASQMADAQIERTIVQIEIIEADIPLPENAARQPKLPNLVATGEVIKFDGFLCLYLEGKDDEELDEENNMLPDLKVDQFLNILELSATERFTRPPARYTEATLVKKLEELGIGRPSTYAPTISTIIKRTYVSKEDRQGKLRNYRVLLLKDNKIQIQQLQETVGAEKGKLFPSDLGILVTDFLVANFPDIVDYKFTADVEEEFDEIARGNLKWNEMMQEFYDPFHQKVIQTEQQAARTSGDRPLGEDPQTGKPVIARLGRYGPIVQIGAADDPAKRFASLRPDQRIETITLAEALSLFQLPRKLGEFEGKMVQVNIGRFGPYVQHDGKYAPIPKELDPYSITLSEAIEIIENKRKADAEKLLMSFPDEIQILNGRWGPYISTPNGNYKLPKQYLAAVEDRSLTLADLQEIIHQQDAEGGPKRKPGFPGRNKTAAAAAEKPAAKLKKENGATDKNARNSKTAKLKSKKLELSSEIIPEVPKAKLIKKKKTTE